MPSLFEFLTPDIHADPDTQSLGRTIPRAKRRLAPKLLTAGTLVLVAPIFVTVRFWNQISFMPDLFLTEYYKFLAEIGALLLSFYLGTIFWQLQMAEARLRRSEQYCRYLVFEMTAATAEAIRQLEMDFDETQTEEVQARDTHAVEQIQRFSAYCDEFRMRYPYEEAQPGSPVHTFFLAAFLPTVGPIAKGLIGIRSVHGNRLALLEQLKKAEAALKYDTDRRTGN